MQLFWTWTSPNLEFATVFVGVLGVAAFGLSFWQAVLAILVGTAGGALAQGVLSARGPSHGVPQMVLSRLGFGYWGNVLPAGLNSITAGIGWFAVNSVSGTFALNTLLHWPKIICLIIIVALQIAIAYFGHNLVHAFERYAFPVLAVIFVIATIWILAKSHPGAAHHAIPGGFLLTTGAVFGYAAGWNPYAADYSRYFPAIYGLHDAGARYTNFLLIIAYWIAPWLAVVFCDQFLRRREDLLQTEKLLFNQTYTNWAGPVAMIVGVALSVWLFSNQTEYVGVVPSHVPSVGDITFEVGFVLTAIVYLTWHAIAGTYRSPARELA